MGSQRDDFRLLVIGLCLAAIGLIGPSLSASSYFEVAVYFLATILVSAEWLDIAVRVWLTHRQEGLDAVHAAPVLYLDPKAKPYALIMSVHNAQQDLDRVFRAFAKNRAQTWFVDDGSDDATALYLRTAGWRCLSMEENQKKPAAIKSLLARLPAEIETVIVLDPDCAPVESAEAGVSDLEVLIKRVQSTKVAACCPRIRIREDGLWTAFQALECEFAFSLGRKGMTPQSITSGVSIYDRRALQNALEQHSQSVYAEDLENTLILLSQGQHVSYDDSWTTETEGKPCVSSWFSQRVGWSYGLMRVYAQRWREVLTISGFNPWSFYNFLVYLGLMGIVLFPVKLIGVSILTLSLLNAIDNLFGFGVIPENDFTDPIYFAVAYCTYTILAAALVVYLRPRLRAMTLLIAVPFYLLYAMVQVVSIAVGFANWFSVRLLGRRLYRDHYSILPAAKNNEQSSGLEAQGARAR